jgi:hypothetical protein
MQRGRRSEVDRTYIPMFQYPKIGLFHSVSCLLSPSSLNLYDFNQLNGLNDMGNGQRTMDNGRLKQWLDKARCSSQT